jgi:hypothetical protein
MAKIWFKTNSRLRSKCSQNAFLKWSETMEEVKEKLIMCHRADQLSQQAHSFAYLIRIRK